MPGTLAKLVAVSGPDKGKTWTLHGEGAHEIGRSSRNEVVLSCKSVSGVHAVLEFRDGLWLLCDHRSRNGTRVNGVRISERRALFDGDRISLGKAGLVFRQGGQA